MSNTDEIIHLHSEHTKTIEYIKKNMLLYQYYTLLLQAALYTYSQKHQDLMFVSITSISIAIVCAYSVTRYFLDYTFLQYRCEQFLEPKFSREAQKSFNLPIYNDECKFKNAVEDSYWWLYFGVNWITSIYVVYDIHSGDSVFIMITISVLVVIAMAIFSSCRIRKLKERHDKHIADLES